MWQVQLLGALTAAHEDLPMAGDVDAASNPHGLAGNHEPAYSALHDARLPNQRVLDSAPGPRMESRVGLLRGTSPAARRAAIHLHVR
jgi:hypothetical protein